MSLKPKKFSEMKRSQDELNSKMKKKERILLDELPPYTYVVCEGTKTEPNYFNQIAEKIPKAYWNMQENK